MNSEHSLPARDIHSPAVPAVDRWADWLQKLFPLGVLLNRAAPTDPVCGIALPGAEPPEDTSMISAYYLSFYE